MTDEKEHGAGLAIDRRTLLKGAVAAGVVGATYAAPKISVVPAYGASSLVSYTVQSGVLCIWFSPNQNSGLGNWHFGGITNNWNPITNSAATWTCFPPAIRVPVVVNGTTHFVFFVGNPDDFIGAPSGTCTVGSTTVTDYTNLNGTVPWSGGGVHIYLDPSTGCEINVMGTVGTLTLGPYCNSSQGGTSGCNDSNSSGVPATWAAGSSTSPIGALTQVGSLGTALTKNNSYTSIQLVSPGLTQAVAAGDQLTLVGKVVQTVVVATAAAAGATSVLVQSFTAADNFPVATPIFKTGPIQAPNGNVGGGVFKDAYYHSGQLGTQENNRCKWALLFQVRCRS